MLALTSSLVANSIAWPTGWALQRDAQFWPITMGRVHQMVTEAAGRAGIAIPDGVGVVHVLCHSGAIPRLEDMEYGGGTDRRWLWAAHKRSYEMLSPLPPKAGFGPLFRLPTKRLFGVKWP